jgi:penicillin G amidase
MASNNWVVHGDHTVTGKPILANDPHLGTSIPSFWTLNEL